MTICAQHRLCLFGDIVDGKIRLNTAGSAVQVVWNELPCRFAYLELDTFVVMPNHIHGIAAFVGAGLALPADNGAASGAPTLGNEGKGVAGSAPALGHAGNGAASGAPTLDHADNGAAGGAPTLGNVGNGAASSAPTLGNADNGAASGAPTLGNADNGVAIGAPTLGNADNGAASGAPTLGNADNGAASGVPTLGNADNGAASSAPALGNAGNGAAIGAPTLGDVVRAFKSMSAIRVNRLLMRSGPLWQRNYYEHVIRDNDELNRIREYITNNPMQWELDRENPAFRDAGAGLKPAHTKDDTWR